MGVCIYHIDSRYALIYIYIHKQQTPGQRMRKVIPCVKGPCRYMVCAWASQGLPYHDVRVDRCVPYWYLDPLGEARMQFHLGCVLFSALTILYSRVLVLRSFTNITITGTCTKQWGVLGMQFMSSALTSKVPCKMPKVLARIPCLLGWRPLFRIFITDPQKELLRTSRYLKD